MRLNLDFSNKKLIILFILFWVFSVIGSNAYLGITMLSIRNILFPTLFFIIISLRRVQLSKEQKNIFYPLFLLFGYGVFSLFFHVSFSLDVIKDFFYFSFIPVIYLSTILLSNKYGNDFFQSIKWTSHFLLYFLFVFTLFELITGIHLPVHAENSYDIPSAFFTNANDLALITIQLLFVISILRKKEDPYWTYLVPFLMTGFVVFTTLSRLGLISFMIVSLSVFLLKTFNWRIILTNILVILGILIYMNIDIPTPKSSTTVVDRTKIRINSMSSIEKEAQPNTLDSTSDHSISSVRVRLDIYKIAFLNPKDFVFGFGFNSDKKVIEKYRTLDYKIINSHSFFIQVLFYFGWMGLVILIAFFGVLMYYALFSSSKSYYFACIILTQALLINIPSSIMRFPLVWIPFFISIAYFSYNKIGIKDNVSSRVEG